MLTVLAQGVVAAGVQFSDLLTVQRPELLGEALTQRPESQSVCLSPTQSSPAVRAWATQPLWDSVSVP